MDRSILWGKVETFSQQKMISDSNAEAIDCVVSSSPYRPTGFSSFSSFSSSPHYRVQSIPKSFF